MRSIFLPEGETFHRWTITGQPQSQSRGKRARTHYPCLCECGTERLVERSNLISGISKDCGCTRLAKNTTHNGWKHPLYKVWKGMKARCLNPTHSGYHRYGGRGIRLCPEWQNDFAAFRDWALAQGWDDALEIDRQDNDGDYSPENCRIVTRTINARNTRANVFVEAFGECKTIAEWALDERCKVHRNTLTSRLKAGEPAESALSRPPSRGRGKK